MSSLGISAFGQDPAAPTKNDAPNPAPQQAAAPVSPCPKVQVQNPNSRGVREGQSATFIANISGGDPKVMPQIMWAVNSGYIKDGQQTKRIEVDTTGAGYYRELTAELWIGGYPGECVVQASASIRVIPPASKADQFGDLEPEKENERLAHIATALSQSDDNLYIIAYAGRTSPRGHAINALRRMRTQLGTVGLNVNRIAVLDGGFRENAEYELWIFPQGAEPPKPTPTVDRRDIVYPKAAAPTRKPRKP